jgi:hypothetical protein
MANFNNINNQNIRCQSLTIEEPGYQITYPKKPAKHFEDNI